LTKSDIVVGLLFGDEGKGTIVDYLASVHKTNAVVRFSGGSQTAHNVITPDGRHHTFAQFGSATFQGIRTFLTKHMLVNPFNMALEADDLEKLIGYDPFTIAYISENALLTTPLHVAANKKREIARGAARHGSCGQGIGETQSYANKTLNAPRISDLKDLDLLEVKLHAYEAFIENEIGEISSLAPSISNIIRSYKLLLEDRSFNIVTDDWILLELKKGYNIFEGSQGILLDEKVGFHPHTTWSTVTSANALKLAEDAGLQTPNVIGVTRSYMTRHGAGPFPSEFKSNDWESFYPENHNKREEFQGGWRGGYLDLELLEYAVRATGGIDTLALTHLDYAYEKVVTGYTELTEPIPSDFFNGDRQKQEVITDLLFSSSFQASAILENIQNDDHLIALIRNRVGNVPLITSYGPTCKDKYMR
jgi:adenylosuccinate synthase